MHIFSLCMYFYLIISIYVYFIHTHLTHQHIVIANIPPNDYKISIDNHTSKTIPYLLTPIRKKNVGGV